MNLSRLLPVAIITLATSTSWSQYKDALQSDRPGITVSPNTIGRNTFQHQTGFNFMFMDNDFGWGMGFNNVFRIGLTERVEINAALDVRYDKITPPFGFDQTLTGVSNTALGIRYNIIDSYDWWMPSVGVQSMMLFTAQSQDYRRNNLGFTTLISTSNQLLDWLSLSTNWGVLYNGNFGPASIPYTVNFGFSFFEKWGAFVEHYADFRYWDAGIDLGASYLITNDILVDISFGTPDVANFPNWFVDFGLTWRLDWRSE